MDVNLFFHNVGELLNRMGQILQAVLSWFGQILVVLASLAGVLAGFVFIVLAYIIVGALLEYWLRWAWRQKRNVWPVITLLAYPIIAAVMAAVIGAVPLTFKWWDLDVDWAIGLGVVAVFISIVVNVFTNPLERPRKWLVAEYRRVRPIRRHGVINALGAGNQSFQSADAAVSVRNLTERTPVTILEEHNGFLRIGPHEWVWNTYVTIS